MREYHAPFEPYGFYHIYNRGNNKENLFIGGKNYAFFLEKWNKYLLTYMDIWAYCLMPNHFHFLIKVHGQNSLPSNESINKFLENQFKRLFSSYTLSFNKVYDRTGSLFQKRFKRVNIESRDYLLTLIHYIHHNPIHHNLAQNYSSWKYSSYLAFLDNKTTKIDVNNVIDLFGSREEFLSFHRQMKDYKKIRNLTLE